MKDRIAHQFRSHHALAVCVMVFTCVGLTGCEGETPHSGPAVSVRWNNVSGPGPEEYESTPEVRHLREYEVGLAMAWNTGDFQIPQLMATDYDGQTEELERSFIEQGRDPYVYLGPQPFTVVSMVPPPQPDRDTRSTTVNVCLAGAPQNIRYTIQPDLHTVIANPRPTRRSYHFTLHEDGTYEVATLAPTSAYSCDDVTYATGYFIPLPDPLPLPVNHDSVVRSAVPQSEWKRPKFDEFILPPPVPSPSESVTPQ